MSFIDSMLEFAKAHSTETLVLVLSCVGVLTFLFVLPQVLRYNMRRSELAHEEHLQALQRGLIIPVDDFRARMAGRCALLVPIVSVACATVVTCFLIYHGHESLFAASLAIWVVAGVVALAAITGGVALIGRLAQIQARQDDEDEEEPSQNEYV